MTADGDEVSLHALAVCQGLEPQGAAQSEVALKKRGG